MSKTGAALILASQSPRRRELMEKMRLPFVCEPSGAEETVPEGTAPERTAEILAVKKAEEVLGRHPGEGVTVIGSDTIVLLDGVIFGKPADEADAYRMLQQLSGRTHQVITGTALLSETGRESFSVAAEVEFYELSPEEIRSYIATGEPFDKAGAYGIQGYGALLVKGIRGDFYTVMGFPVAETWRRLRKDFL